MQHLRKTQSPPHKLTNGPGKLCQALSIDRTLTNTNAATNNDLFVADDGYTVIPDNITSTTRIGVEYAGTCALYPWRYYISDSQFVSRKEK